MLLQCYELDTKLGQNISVNVVKTIVKKRIARVRCGNFERPNRFLLEEDKKK